MEIKVIISVMGLLVLAACAQQTANVTMVGVDGDARGCIGSAGYSWCEKTVQCERPWELAKKENFELSANQFSQFCQK
ncbi:MAG: hypothetical protein EXR38_06140 [Methylotenera sp.]|nr:hypothetical protein [Methylotenera sp.]MSQ00057.1 hypothetical protein [Methylotenera sp.]